MKRFFGVLLVLCVAATVFAGGGAQGAGAGAASNFPNRQIEFLVPYAPGSGNDIAVRTISPTLEKHLGQPIVVTNEPAASGLVALTRVGKSIRPDGYTLCYANIVATTSQSVLGDFTVDPSTEYAHLGIITAEPGVIVARKNGPYKNLADLVNDAKARPGQVTWGGTGLYSLDGLISLSLEDLAGIKFSFVDNLGGSDGMTAVMGGHLDVMGDAILGSMQAYLDGAIEIIGIGGDERAPEMPNVPTFKEQGYSLTIDGAQRTIFTRSGVPQDVLNVLYAAVKDTAEDPEFIERCKQVGLRNLYRDPVEAHRVVDSFMEVFRGLK